MSSEKALPHFILLLCKDKAGIEASMHVCVAINGQNFEVCLTQRSLHLGGEKGILFEKATSVSHLLSIGPVAQKDW